MGKRGQVLTHSYSSPLDAYLPMFLHKRAPTSWAGSSPFSIKNKYKPTSTPFEQDLRPIIALRATDPIFVRATFAPTALTSHSEKVSRPRPPVGGRLLLGGELEGKGKHQGFLPDHVHFGGALRATTKSQSQLTKPAYILKLIFPYTIISRFVQRFLENFETPNFLFLLRGRPRHKFLWNNSRLDPLELRREDK